MNEYKTTCAHCGQEVSCTEDGQYECACGCREITESKRLQDRTVDELYEIARK